MITIYLPTFAAYKNDVETMLDILEKNVDQSKFGIGLEIVGKPEHFLSQEGIEKIAENINSVARGVKSTVHGFSGIDIYEIGGKESHIADMSRTEGKKLLENYIGLAKEIGSHYVHVHGAAGYRGIRIPKDKKEKLENIRKKSFIWIGKSYRRQNSCRNRKPPLSLPL